MEPTYKFVRGTGWVVEDNTVTMRCGTVVRYEIRPFKTGEHAAGFYTSRSTEECLAILKTWEFGQFGVRGGWERPSSEYRYFILTPVMV